MGAALFWVPSSETPTGGRCTVSASLKRVRKQEGGKLILIMAPLDLKQSSPKHTEIVYRWTAPECKNNALNIFMRCRFYSTCVEFCSANGDYNSKLILHTPEMKQSVCESLRCSSRASWRTKHEWLSSFLSSPCSYWHCIDFIVSAACKHYRQGC